VARPDPEVVAMLTSGLTASIALDKVTLHKHLKFYFLFRCTLCHHICHYNFIFNSLQVFSINSLDSLDPLFRTTFSFTWQYCSHVELLGWTNGIWKSSSCNCSCWRDRSICSPGLLLTIDILFYDITLLFLLLNQIHKTFVVCAIVYTCSHARETDSDLVH
jgi:hypothetical protein